jgi:hypothetical protein
MSMIFMLVGKEMSTFVTMSSLTPSSYFNGIADLHQLDDSMLSQHINSAPYDASLRLLAAFTSGDVTKGQSMLYSRERMLLAKMLKDHKEEKSTTLEEVETPLATYPESTTGGSGQTLEVPVKNLDLDSQENVSEEETDIIGTQENPKPKSKKNKIQSEVKNQKSLKSFRLVEYGGISPFAQWLISFKVDDLDKRLKKEAKKEKKRQLEENARKSVTRSSSTISEPLAEILRTQGHFEDAKKMYGQLMQKFPEKSSYFAAKIEELKK